MPRYSLKLKGLDEKVDHYAPLEIEVENHDDIFKIIDIMKAKSVLPEDEAAEFIIGLKLFTEVMLRHRKEPLFQKLAPHMKDFMKALKSQ